MERLVLCVVLLGCGLVSWPLAALTVILRGGRRAHVGASRGSVAIITVLASYVYAFVAWGIFVLRSESHPGTDVVISVGRLLVFLAQGLILASAVCAILSGFRGEPRAKALVALALQAIILVGPPFLAIAGAAAIMFAR